MKSFHNKNILAVVSAVIVSIACGGAARAQSLTDFLNSDTPKNVAYLNFTFVFLGVITLILIAAAILEIVFSIRRDTQAGGLMLTDDDIEPGQSLVSMLFGDTGVRLSMLAVFIVVLITGMVVTADSIDNAVVEHNDRVDSPIGLTANRAVLRIDGDRNGLYVDFKHDMHKKMLGGVNSCDTCHHLHSPTDKTMQCWKCHSLMHNSSSIFDHSLHEKALGGNTACDKCHKQGVPKTRESAKPCAECHAANMNMDAELDNNGRFDFHAMSYENAMHTLCVGCHKSRAEQVGRPALGNCNTCHPNIEPPGSTLK